MWQVDQPGETQVLGPAKKAQVEKHTLFFTRSLQPGHLSDAERQAQTSGLGFSPVPPDVGRECCCPRGHRVAPSRPRPSIHSTPTHFSVVEIHVFTFIVSLFRRKGKLSVLDRPCKELKSAMLPNVSASRARGHRQVTPESSHRPRKASGKALRCFNRVNVRPTRQEAPQSGPARTPGGQDVLWSLCTEISESLTPISHMATLRLSEANWLFWDRQRSWSDLGLGAKSLNPMEEKEGLRVGSRPSTPTVGTKDSGGQ